MKEVMTSHKSCRFHHGLIKTIAKELTSPRLPGGGKGISCSTAQIPLFIPSSRIKTERGWGLISTGSYSNLSLKQRVANKRLEEAARRTVIVGMQ